MKSSEISAAVCFLVYSDVHNWRRRANIRCFGTVCVLDRYCLRAPQRRKLENTTSSNTPRFPLTHPAAQKSFIPNQGSHPWLHIPANLKRGVASPADDAAWICDLVFWLLVLKDDDTWRNQFCALRFGIRVPTALRLRLPLFWEICLFHVLP